VIRIGSRVLRTRSRSARHVALNFEIAISSILVSYHSQRPWLIRSVVTKAKDRSSVREVATIPRPITEGSQLKTWCPSPLPGLAV
jgi:hypothetical protein